MDFWSQSLKSKICVITGATAGIGQELTHQLLKGGAKVLIIARNPIKTSEMILQFEMELEHPQIEFYLADLSSMEDIRKVAAQILSEHSHIDLLINNVGGFFTKRNETIDGYEMTFALNYLGPFLLTGLLFPLLLSSQAGRIINLISIVYQNGTIKFQDLHRKQRFFGWLAYAQSKLALVMFTRSLARKIESTRVKVNCIHPGIVNTNIGFKKFSMQGLFFLLTKLFAAVSPVQASEWILALVQNPKFNNLNGALISKNKKRKIRKKAQNFKKQDQLWEISENLTRFHWLDDLVSRKGK